jgi:hypothetical protein
VHRIRKRAQRAAVCAAAVVSLMYCRRSARSGTRGACYRRRRLDWTLRTRQLRQGLREERQFVSRYGLDSEGFAEVCNRLRDVKSNAGGAGAGPITAEIILSAVLRFLRGGAWQDIVDMHGIGESTLRAMIMKVLTAVHRQFATVPC